MLLITCKSTAKCIAVGVGSILPGGQVASKRAALPIIFCNKDALEDAKFQSNISLKLPRTGCIL
jgi:hypothetical protein